jgi:predicted dehydrogenase
MPAPLRIGIVGTARILPSHLHGWKAVLAAGLADFRVTALVGRTREGALAFRRRGEGPEPRPPVMPGGDPLAAPHMYVSDVHEDTVPDIYPDVPAMLEAGAVDAAVLLSPVGLHHGQGLECLRAGVHVFCEKPLAVSVRAGTALVEEARRGNLVLGVAEGVRYDAGVRLQRWAVTSGLLGPVELMALGGLGSFWSPDRIVAETPWRHRKVEAGGGPAIDIGVHQFSHVRTVAGEVAAVAALAARQSPERIHRDSRGEVAARIHADVEDAYHAAFRLASGGTGQLSFSWSGHGPATFWPGGGVIYGAHGACRGGRLFLDGGEEVGLEEKGRAAGAPLEQWCPGGIRDSKALQFLDFVRAVDRRRAGEAGAEMFSSGEEGLRDLAAAFAILESDAAGRTVTLGEVLDGSADAYQHEIDAHWGLL